MRRIRIKKTLRLPSLVRVNQEPGTQKSMVVVTPFVTLGLPPVIMSVSLTIAVYDNCPDWAIRAVEKSGRPRWRKAFADSYWLGAREVDKIHAHLWDLRTTRVIML